MGVLHCYLTSNKARVTDRAAVLRVLEDYFYQCDIDVQGEEGSAAGTIGFSSGEGGPDAVRYEDYDLPEDEDEEFDALSDHQDEDGERGFVKLLREVAPYLETPLTVQAVSYWNDGFPIWAREWHVRPGAEEVEFNSFKHSEDEGEA